MSTNTKKKAKATEVQEQVQAIESAGSEYQVAPEFQDPPIPDVSADVAVEAPARKRKASKRNAGERHVSRSTADENGIKDGDNVREVDGKELVFRVEVDDQDPTARSPAIDDAVDAPAPKKSKKGTKAKVELTIALLAEGYLHALEDSGAGHGTVASYGIELRCAMRELGAATPVALLTDDRVAEYFKGDAVMRTRSGKPKAPPTYLKTQRVFRQALVWAANERLIERAPIPEITTAKS